MGDFTADVRDIRFNLYEQLGVTDLCSSERFGDFDKETFDVMLDEAHRFSREVLAPLNGPADREGCHFEDGSVRMPSGFANAYKQFCEGGWLALSSDVEHGGTGLPVTVGIGIGELFMGACTSFMFTPGLTRAAANLIAEVGSPEQKARYCEKMNAGQWSGTMCLTEAQAGSAVGDIRTKATKDGDDYLLEGEKIFITSGDHDLTENIIHLVLARTEGAPPGFKGLSLFIVPKIRVADDGNLGESNHVTCSRIEEKMGIHASATCTMVFGDSGPCRTEIIGSEGQGLPLMFHMMNEARIGVGIQGHALGAAAYQAAWAYALERIQGVDIKNMRDVNAPRVPIVAHPDVRRMLLNMKAVSEGSRILLMTTAYYVDRARVEEDEKKRDHYMAMVDLLTPLCKAYCSDQAFRITEWGIQVLGGYGYCSEYPLEQYMRDVKIASIYEGTNGIQALDLLGRKVSRQAGMLFMAFMGELTSWVDKDHKVLGELAGKVLEGKDHLGSVAGIFAMYNMQKDMDYPVLHATPFLEMMGHITVAALLVRSAITASDKLEAMVERDGVDATGRKEFIENNPEAAFYSNKIKSAAFFVNKYIPLAGAIRKTIESTDRSALEVVF